MRNLIFSVGLFCVLLCATTISAQAQGSYPRVEVFGGYSYFNADPLPNDNFDQREDAHGFALSAAGNLNSKFGVVAEFSGHYGSLSVFGIDRSWRNYTYLFGPRFSVRGERVTGFGHVLVGGVKSDLENSQETNDFALALGGGVDVNVNRRLSVRAVQADYIPVRDEFLREWVNKFRVQTGIVFKF